MNPIKRENLNLADGKYYQCPLYKTLEQHKSTCGQMKSSNLITFVNLKCDDDNNPDHWILRGCALICQLND